MHFALGILVFTLPRYHAPRTPLSFVTYCTRVGIGIPVPRYGTGTMGYNIAILAYCNIDNTYSSRYPLKYPGSVRVLQYCNIAIPVRVEYCIDTQCTRRYTVHVYCTRTLVLQYNIAIINQTTIMQSFCGISPSSLDISLHARGQIH